MIIETDNKGHITIDDSIDIVVRKHEGTYIIKVLENNCYNITIMKEV